MTHSLRIAIADDEPDMRHYLAKMLPRMGHEVVVVATNGRELVEKCRVAQPDLVITDIKMPELDGIQAANQLFRQRPIPVILISAFHDDDLIERAESDQVVAYLVKPIKQAQLAPTIAIAVRRFAQFQAVQSEATNLKQALADRKLIEKAKGIVMKRSQMDEATAFRHLQKLASNQNLKLVKLAEAIVVADGVL